jgi:hypothetical protein
MSKDREWERCLRECFPDAMRRYASLLFASAECYKKCRELLEKGG